MARRGGTARFRCPETGCAEQAFFDYSSQADYARLARSQRDRPWKCTRHRNPERVLTPSNTSRTVVVTAEKSKRFPNLDSLFWREGDEPDVGSGYLFGPGFAAHAADFPEGTRLVITIAVEPPVEAPNDSVAVLPATEGTPTS